MCLQTFRRENDRFWMLGVHPEQALIAAGHDSGMVVFKLERERPAYSSVDGQLFYVRERDLRRSVLGTGSDVHLVPLRPRGAAGGHQGALGTGPRTLTVNGFNPGEDNVLITRALDGMVCGGLFDQVGGGFHRYCVDATWTVPHFEKMLYDNGQLLELLAAECRRVPHERWSAAMRRTVAWIEREMTADDGACIAALDAEVDGREGQNYL
jgi:hypothetical protein